MDGRMDGWTDGRTDGWTDWMNLFNSKGPKIIFLAATTNERCAELYTYEAKHSAPAHIRSRP